MSRRSPKRPGRRDHTAVPGLLAVAASGGPAWLETARTAGREALDATGGVKKKAAALLGVSFRSFRYRCEKLGLHDSDPDGA